MSKPAAVIRKVEDSPDWLDQRLVEAYLCTVYRVSSPPADITIGRSNLSFETWLNKRAVGTFAIVTAWNPFSKPTSGAKNRLKNNALEAELQKVSRFVLFGSGIDGIGNWPSEESFWALDISPENAIRLGMEYKQNAIVWWQKGGVPELWWLW